MLSLLRKKAIRTTVDTRPSIHSAMDDLPDDIKTETQKHINTICDILVDNQADNLAKQIIKRTLELVWNLPASENHHHSGEFGLFIHSLEAAINSLMIFENKLFFQHSSDGSIDSLKTRKSKPKEQYAFLLSGLLLDIREAFSFLVEGDSKQQHHDDPRIHHLIAYFNDYIKTGTDQQDPYLRYNMYISKMLESVRNYGDFIDLDSINIEERELYSYFISGLMHDIGKALDVVVSSQNDIWNPFKEGLYHLYHC
ncbi:hypothetical protein A45J_2528 [hot springs metagenome]|uniref:Uncharacterized domain-containing protein n=1 Tax=hot springs metagenome TaxID=433727 RepID=A0A5J4KZR6_9ZZZZ